MKIRKVKGLFKVSMGNKRWAWFKTFAQAKSYALEVFGISINTY